MEKNWLENAFTANVGTYSDDAIDALAYYLNNDIKVTNNCYGYFTVNVRNTNIKKVIFNNPATIVIWSDNTKTIVKCSKDDTFDPEKGLAMAISKRIYGDNFKKIFKEWLPEEEEISETIKIFADGIQISAWDVIQNMKTCEGRCRCKTDSVIL